MIDVNYENEIFPCIMLMSHEDVIHCVNPSFKITHNSYIKYIKKYLIVLFCWN